MRRKHGKRILSLGLALAMALPGAGNSALQVKAESAKENVTQSSNAALVDGNVMKFTVDDTGVISMDEESEELIDEMLIQKRASSYDPDGIYAANTDTPFSWDNVNMYFVITDRFYNGDESNDHSYGRSAAGSGNVSKIKDSGNKEDAVAAYTRLAGSYAGSGESNASNYKNGIGTFHGGDLKGLTDYIENGYFDALGTNAIWITAPYEQVHGAVCGGGFKHYAYHGYYTLDYTEVDANMGTAEELEKFIDTAHAHGIRVVFDVVMNHSGYPDGYTIAEYYGESSGLLSNNWRDIYFGTNESNLKWDADYENVTESFQGGIIRYNDAWNSSWFTTSWQRMVKDRYGSGYTNGEGTSLTLCSAGLPDFKTEDTNPVSIPDILKKKWTAEGRYDTKAAETKAMLAACGYSADSATVRQYLVAWLSNWVREYGVDGFRCDTAKHVEIESWKELKEQCKKALTTWRSNHKDKPGADWTDDFWMTGEVYDYGADPSLNSGGTDYAKAFDSLINFSFQGNGGKKGTELESTYSSYASSINSSPNNVLSYISSHDKGLGARGASAGTALLLCPGGVQTYYGDETARANGSGSGDQPSRSQMTWNDTACLSNWQKVGRFRRNHIAVGAGQHKQLSTSPYTFSRTYTGTATVGTQKVTDYQDKVVISLPGSAGNYDVPVSGVFDDGTILTDEYSGEEYTVSGGKVSVTCDGNGVILLAEPSDAGNVTTKAKFSASVAKGSASGGVYKDDEITVKITAQNVTGAVYQVNNKAEVSFTDTAEITFGGDTAYEEETVIKVKGTGAEGSDKENEAVTSEFTYTREAEPEVGKAADGFYIRMSKSAYETASGSTTVPLIWVYDDSKAYSGTNWDSRDKMILDDAGKYYEWSKAELTGGVYVIVTNGDSSWRSVPDKKNGTLVSGSVELDPAKDYTDKSAFSQVVIAAGDPCKVTINYVDQANTANPLKSIYRVGLEGDSYHTYASEIDGYELTGTPKNANGTFTTDEIVVNYVYTSGENPVTKNGTVIIHYVDEAGNAIAESGSQSGTVGAGYSTTGRETITFQGKTYKLKVTPENATGQYTEESIDVTYIYEEEADPDPNPSKSGKVYVHYVDEEEKEIAATKTLTGTIGDDYEAAAQQTIQREEKTYRLKEGQTTAKGKFAEEDIDVTYIYEEVAAPDPSRTGKVLVQYVDEEGNEIANSQSLSGAVDTAYNTTGEETITFEGKIYQLRDTPKNAAGTYTEKDIIVIYRYTEVVPTGSVTIQYVDEEGSVIKDTVNQYGAIGETYTVDIQSVIKTDDKSYTLKRVEGNTDGQYTKEPVVVTFIYGTAAPAVEEGTVLVKYVDESGVEIMASRTMTGTVGEPYEVMVPETIKAADKNYKLKETVQAATGVYQKDPKEVICTYVLEEEIPVLNTGKVTAKYVDSQGKEIIRSQTQSGNIGDSYTTDIMSALTIEDKTYRLTGIPQNASGNYTEGEIVVTYQYEITTEEIKKGSVVIQYVNEDGNSIRQSQMISGTIGDSYTIDITSVIQVGDQTYQLKATPSNASGQYTEAEIIVTCIYEVDTQPVPVGNVFVKYVDEDGNDLADAQVMSGSIGDDYTTNAMPAIVGESQTYLLKAKPKNATGKYSEKDIFVIYIYEVAKEPVTEGTVVVKYVDEQGRELAESVTLTGTIGTSYGTIALPSITIGETTYRIQMTPINAAGKYTADEIVVVYVYEQENKTTDSGSTDSDKPDSGSTDSDKPDSGSTDGDKPDSGSTDSDKPDSGSTDSDKPDSGSTDSDKTDSGSADSSKTDSGSADSNKTDVPDTPQSVTKTSVQVGDTVTDDSGKAYYEIAGASTVKYAAPAKAAKQVTIPASVQISGKTYRVTAVAEDAFGDDTTLQEVKLGSNVTKIGSDAFNGCKKLKKVTLDAKLTTIGEAAFYGCTKLTSITIPAKVKKIGSEAFYGCKSLKKITIKTTKLTKKTVGSRAFKGIYKKALIQVPKSKLGTYKTVLRAKGVSKNAKIKK